MANDRVSGWTFENQPWNAAAAGAPEWNFDHREGCFPTAAIWDGKQTPAGSEYISANNEVIYTGCGPTTNTNKAHPFPTYYRIEKCEYSKSDGFKFKEYHVMYNVLFPYSTNEAIGHTYDWEWAVLKYERIGSSDNFRRKSIVLAAHGKTKKTKWADYPATEWWGKNGNKPVIKFQYDGHGLESKYNNLGKSYSGQDWLSDTKYENFGKYKWGNADSYPDQFRPGGTRDLCWYV